MNKSLLKLDLIQNITEGSKLRYVTTTLQNVARFLLQNNI